MIATLAKYALLAFAVFTLGFGVGKEVGRRQAATTVSPGPAALPPPVAKAPATVAD